MSLHIQILRNYYENRVMPLNFKYDEAAKTVDIEFADGSVVRYYDIAPTVAFLDSRNPARARDFFNYLESMRLHNLACPITGNCNCRIDLKAEVIQEPTNQLPGPATRPVLVQQQSGTHT